MAIKLDNSAMPAPQVVPYKDLTLNITKDVLEHPRDLGKFLAERYGVTRATTSNVIRRLETEGWVSRSGPSTHPVYSPGFKRRRAVRSDLKGLEEGALWEEQFAQYFSLPSNIRGIVQHGFTEMTNNAIDHSGGTFVWTQISQDQGRVEVRVTDDGVGIFKRIADALQLPDLRQALFELAKGKFTTDPSKHSGEGVFFTSRMFDEFGIRANGLYFDHEHSAADDLLIDHEPKVPHSGTSAIMSIALASTRTTSEVFLKYMNAPDDYGFNRTVVPMRLAQYEGAQLISRSQAKRLIARFDKFKTVLLDFSGVPEIGQAFADEIFRVYARQHPGVELLPTNMTEQVERMWRRAAQSDMGTEVVRGPSEPTG